MIECETFIGRLKDICEGRVDLSLQKVNEYRRRWGLGPLDKLNGDVIPVEPAAAPSLLVRAWTFAKAFKRHAADGFRRRTRAEIDTLAAICESCEHFDGRACKLCGCHCSNRESDFFNKLAWESEQCPERKWPV